MDDGSTLPRVFWLKLVQANYRAVTPLLASCGHLLADAAGVGLRVHEGLTASKGRPL